MAEHEAGVRSRPDMQSYGISDKAEGMLDWSWVDAQAEKSRNYWICTVRPDSTPHATPVWGVWLDGTLYFGCGRDSVKARNLMANPALSVHLESGDDAVMFEGVAEEMRDFSGFAPIADAYEAKYNGYRPEGEADKDTLFIKFRPRKAMAWLETDFVRSATRWTFA